MASVLGKIESFEQSLTPSEVKIVNFLKENIEDATRFSIHEVARKSGVSVASVSRLAVALGYRDWKDFRRSLIAEASAAPGRRFSDIGDKDGDEAIVQKIFDCSIFSLKDTFEQIDAKSVIRAAEAIERAGRIAFFGSGRSGCFAMEEALRFALLNPAATAASDEYQMILQSAGLSKGHVAFGFSNSGRSRSTVAALAEARRNKAFVIGIANYRNTPLETVSDIYFCTSFPRAGEISSTLTARIALLCIMDSIYVLASTRGKLSARADALLESLDRNLRLAVRKRSANGRQHGGA